MELFHHTSSWKQFIFYKQSESGTFRFYKEPNTVDHVFSKHEEILYHYRNRINEYSHAFASNNWEYYKKRVNPYEFVFTKKKYKNFPDSIATIKPLSRSYFKMVEMIDLIGFYHQQSKHIRTAHVCEGPGGFIEALFDTSIKNKIHIDETLAMTLQSTRHNIPGWKYTANFLKKHDVIKIIYGKDNTGDITKVDNQQYYIHYAEKRKYDIFTADGGFDFSCNYMKQEQLVFPLLLASTKLGFEVLKQGGTFILKFIDFYNKATTDLLFFLSCHFLEWTMYKPAMSRPCNPEHYFIGKGFTGCSEDAIDALYAWCSRMENMDVLGSLLQSDYSPEFSTIIERIREASSTSQIEYLTGVFSIIEKNDDHLIQQYLQYNMQSSYEFCKRFNIPMSLTELIFSTPIAELQNDPLDSSL
jgi:23S rRNA U2552 (ribose-2'-O)-methylase RlmE/FtsJ